MQAMGLCGFFAQAFDLVLLIRIEVAFEPMPIAGVFIGTLPRKNMRGNAVKEHTVVAGYYLSLIHIYYLIDELEHEIREPEDFRTEHDLPLKVAYVNALRCMTGLTSHMSLRVNEFIDSWKWEEMQ